MENNPQHISLVYLSTDTVFTFRRELQVLQQHYPSQFLIFFENNNPEIAYNEFQETLEVIINSNTMPEIDFILSGDEELINQAENALYILDIDKKSIINSESDNHLFTL